MSSREEDEMAYSHFVTQLVPIRQAVGLNFLRMARADRSDLGLLYSR
jgi:hypothetical protein